jgi:hypothetical protein
MIRPVRLDPDLFEHIWILERAMAVCAIYIYECATLWTVAFNLPIFKRKKNVREP